MVEMSSPSVIDGAFGVRSVKLPMRGSHTAQMGWQLSHILEKRPLSLAILAVDAYSLMGPPDDDEEIVEYLWNDAALDDVNYLLNRDVLLVKLPRLLRNRGLPLEGKRDAMYQWVDVTFSEKSVLETVTFRPQQEMTPADARLERSTEHIRRNLIPSIEAHPEIVTRLSELSAYMRRGLKARGIPIIEAQTPIIPIYTYTAEATLIRARQLYDAGVYVNPVLPPATPPELCLLRTSYMASLDEKLLDEALDIFGRVFAEPIE